MGGGGHWGHSFAKEGSDPGLLKLNREKGKTKGENTFWSSARHGCEARNRALAAAGELAA